MSLFVVTYQYVNKPGDLNRVRPERYGFFAQLEADGALMASGQLLDTDWAEGLLVVQARDAAEAATLLDPDPFVRAGLVAERVIARWNATTGAWIS